MLPLLCTNSSTALTSTARKRSPDSEGKVSLSAPHRSVCPPVRGVTLLPKFYAVRRPLRLSWSLSDVSRFGFCDRL